MDFATKIKAYRNMMCLTQDSIADALGINRSAYAYYESGKIAPNSDVVYALAKLFSIPVEYLTDSPSNNATEAISANMVLSDYEPHFPEAPVPQETTEDDFASLSPDEKMLIVRYRLMKATEEREKESPTPAEIDVILENMDSYFNT